MYTIESMKINDFRLIHKANVNLKDAGLVHICGANKDTPHANSNMAGKSTLIHALTWCLYGCDATGLTIASSVLRPSVDSCVVRISFLDNDGTTWFVVRKRHRNPPPGTPTTELNVNAEQVGAAEDVQHHIDAVLGTRDLFLSAHVFSYGEKQQPFATSSPKDKQALFELLLPGGDLDAALRTTQDKRDKMSGLIAKYQRIATALRGWVSATKESKKYDEIDVRQRLRTIRDEMNWYEKRLGETQVAVESVQAQYKAALAPAEEAACAATDAEGVLQLRREQEAALVKRLDTAEKKLASLKENVCPFCKSVLNRNKIVGLRSEQEKLVTYCRDALGELEDSDVLKAAMRTARETAGIVMSACEKLEDVLDEKQQALTELSAKYSAHKAAYDELDAALSVRKSNTVAAGTMRIVEELGKLVEEAQDYDEILAFWEYGFGRSGIHAYRLDQVTPTMNALARGYSNLLFGDGTSVVYSTQKKIKTGEYRDKFDLYVETPGGDRAEAISAGQFMRRDLIHLFTTVKLAGMLKKRSVRLLIFDEAFRTLDTAGTQATIAILRSLLKDADTILVVEHNDELTTAMDQQITITREQGLSSVSGPHVIV